MSETTPRPMMGSCPSAYRPRERGETIADYHDNVLMPATTVETIAPPLRATIGQPTSAATPAPLRVTIDQGADRPVTMSMTTAVFDLLLRAAHHRAMRRPDPDGTWAGIYGAMTFGLLEAGATDPESTASLPAARPDTDHQCEHRTFGSAVC